jgi:hypothetical protein
MFESIMDIVYMSLLVGASASGYFVRSDCYKVPTEHLLGLPSENSTSKFSKLGTITEKSLGRHTATFDGSSFHDTWEPSLTMPCRFQ